VALLEKIKDRIRKLLGLARNNPSYEEARSAEDAAKRLLEQHGLCLEDVQDEHEELDRHLLGASKYYIEHWKLSLAMVLANHHKCTIIEPVEEAYKLGKAVGWGLSLTREELQKALTG
jgi:hypothetical protein